MDRNCCLSVVSKNAVQVALRKESVDRNCIIVMVGLLMFRSLSARRAWIEMFLSMGLDGRFKVALRKESVDRNYSYVRGKENVRKSLSARRAWIEM